MWGFNKPKKRVLRYTVKSKGHKNTNHTTLANARKEAKKRSYGKIFKYKTRTRVK